MEEVAQGLRPNPVLGDLSKFIADRWKQVDGRKKLQYQELAAKDKRRYGLEVVQWHQTQRQEDSQLQDSQDIVPDSSLEGDRGNDDQSLVAGDIEETNASQHPSLHLPSHPLQNPLGARQALGDPFHPPSHTTHYPMETPQAHGDQNQFTVTGMGDNGAMNWPSNHRDTGQAESRSRTTQMQFQTSGHHHPSIGSLGWVAQELGEDGVDFFVHLFRHG